MVQIYDKIELVLARIDLGLETGAGDQKKILRWVKL